MSESNGRTRQRGQFSSEEKATILRRMNRIGLASEEENDAYDYASRLIRSAIARGTKLVPASDVPPLAVIAP